MNLTVPHHQKDPALSCFAALSISLPITTDPSLRGGVTRGDCSNCHVRFVQIEPCLNTKPGCRPTSHFVHEKCNTVLFLENKHLRTSCKKLICKKIFATRLLNDTCHVCS